MAFSVVTRSPTSTQGLNDSYTHLSRLKGLTEWGDIVQVSPLTALPLMRALLDTLEGWRSKLKGHYLPHVLPNEWAVQLHNLKLICFIH